MLRVGHVVRFVYGHAKGSQEKDQADTTKNVCNSVCKSDTCATLCALCDCTRPRLKWVGGKSACVRRAEGKLKGDKHLPSGAAFLAIFMEGREVTRQSQQPGAKQIRNHPIFQPA